MLFFYYSFIFFFCIFIHFIFFPSQINFTRVYFELILILVWWIHAYFLRYILFYFLFIHPTFFVDVTAQFFITDFWLFLFQSFIFDRQSFSWIKRHFDNFPFVDPLCFHRSRNWSRRQQTIIFSCLTQWRLTFYLFFYLFQLEIQLLFFSRIRYSFFCVLEFYFDFQWARKSAAYVIS